MTDNPPGPPTGAQQLEDEVADFELALPLADLKPGEVTPVVVHGRQVAMYIVDGTPYCTEDLCTHDMCLISEGGYVDGDEVECACHGGRFSVKTGAVTALPPVVPLRCFPVEVRGADVYVRIE